MTTLNYRNLGRGIEGLVLAVGLFMTTQLFALSTDQDQPIEIEADAAELDDRTGITVYSGNVIVIQGSMHLYGNKLTITYNDDNSLKTAVMFGGPAKFRQMPDSQDAGEIKGRGIRIDYLALENKLIMTEEAELTQNGKLFKAYKIEYDTEKSKMVARKAIVGETTPSGKPVQKDSGRIKVILPPRQK